MNRHARCTSLVVVVVASLFVNRASADYGTGDSASFTLDLLSMPPSGMVGDWSDSGSFSLDLIRMNRDSSASASFFFGDNPNPAPSPVMLEVPSSASPEQPFDVRVVLRNNGGPGDHGGVSISFPDLADTDATIPPYESAIADVAVHPESTFTTVGFADAGDTIYYEGDPIIAQHLLVEGDEDAWEYDEEQTLTLTVMPHQIGELTIRVRLWVAGPGSTYGPPVYRWPEQTGPDNELDQQGYWSREICVSIAYAESVPGSVEYARATELHDTGISGTGVKIGMLGSAGDGESGLPWTGHPALQANVLNGDPDQQNASSHETGVASIMVGIDAAAGIVPGNWAYRGFATNSPLAAEEVDSLLPWDNIDNGMLALKNGGCQVINYSGGFDPSHPVGGLLVAEINRTIDDIVDADQVTIVCAAGNSSQLSTIACPANAFNVLAVGSLGASENGGDRISGPWDTTSSENIPGPTSGTYVAGRCKPDIVAPGDCTVASTSANHYVNDGTGSSLASPHVAGTVALLIEAARAAGAYFVEPGGAVDPRVIRSAILTGADKSVWTKPGVRPDPSWHTDGPVQPLDEHLGAGGLDAIEAEKVLLGEDDETTVRHMAYDTITWADQSLTLQIGQVAEGSTLIASLIWNAHVYGIVADISDLDLYLVKDGIDLAWSRSTIDNVEHLFVTGLEAGEYALRIEYAGHVLTDSEKFALSYRLVFPSFSPGDMDCNGVIEMADVPPFVEALLDPSGFDAAHPNCDSGQADVDGSGDVNGDDVSAFVTLLLAEE